MTEVEKLKREFLEYLEIEKGSSLKTIENYDRYFQFDPAMLKIRHSACIEGYWQHAKYFENITNQLGTIFSFRQEAQGRNSDMLHKILASNSVAVHIRRGDYVINPMYGARNMQYYKDAVAFISSLLTDIHYFIFSDDPAWVHREIQWIEQKTIIDFNSESEAHEDLRLMSACKHQIIANSTFSWWGAWLNKNPNKLVVIPKKWRADSQFDTSGLYLNEWHAI